jgi:mannose-1-phosphate guanylyltransferase
MPNKHHYGLVLAGGRGTRFWPRSRTKTPKQLLSFVSDQTLIVETVERLRALIPPERIWVLTSEVLRPEIRRQLKDVPAHQILAEPCQRNTAPCLGLAAQIIAEQDPDAVLGVFPADHHIGKPARFRHWMKGAFKAAEQGKLATIGIYPRWAETGYGWLELPKGTKPGTAAPVKVRKFREKPDQANANKFLKAGNFFWNGGIFCWRAGVFLNEMRQHLPKTAALLAALPGFHDKRFAKRLAETYPMCENISVDYAVLERSDRVVSMATDDFGWNDLGSWHAVYELMTRDANDIAAKSPVIAENSRGCYVEAPGKLVALVGVDDLVIVDTPGALLVARRSQAQAVGLIVKRLEKLGKTELL